ncbi:hypothetical protein HNP55_002369 [Paucibacter oligotrophus]|uniref:peptidylprolyl isomerase n=1 Tax=Roseateles oligotrophus TaxID=1769250 RepID=A0A840L735_9BURK|nr:peptidylprolyl isomerase [Roseateles oligotrophus]MBB4843846.1 hypothetical protein [Roseateles oligotrophus]
MSVKHILTPLLLASAMCHVSAMTPWGEKDEYDTLREAHTYHIMFSSQQAAQDVHRRLSGLSGPALFEQFQKIARAESKDPGSATTGGDLGAVQEGTMVKSFEQALFSLAPKTVSEPVKSEYGWHLIYASDFKESKVADICASSLATSLKSASAADKPGLTVAAERIPSEKFAPRVLALIGSEWSQPLKDWNGNLAFVRTYASKAKLGVATAVVHTEYLAAVLASSAAACRRSARQEYVVDCNARTATPSSRSEFEGRGAVGRRLAESRTLPVDRIKLASDAGFHGQLVASLCAAR